MTPKKNKDVASIHDRTLKRKEEGFPLMVIQLNQINQRLTLYILFLLYYFVCLHVTVYNCIHECVLTITLDLRRGTP